MTVVRPAPGPGLVAALVLVPDPDLDLVAPAALAVHPVPVALALAVPVALAVLAVLVALVPAVLVGPVGYCEQFAGLVVDLADFPVVRYDSVAGLAAVLVGLAVPVDPVGLADPVDRFAPVVVGLYLPALFLPCPVFALCHFQGGVSATQYCRQAAAFYRALLLSHRQGLCVYH